MLESSSLVGGIISAMLRLMNGSWGTANMIKNGLALTLSVWVLLIVISAGDESALQGAQRRYREIK